MLQYAEHEVGLAGGNDVAARRCSPHMLTYADVCGLMQVVMMSDPQIETWKNEAMEAWKSVQVLNLLALLVQKYKVQKYKY
jgi:hypothetical protein